MCKRITPFAIITIALLICIPAFAQHFLGAFSGSALHLDTQIETPAQNNNAQTLPEQQAGDTIQFQLFVPASAGQTTNGYALELDLPGKTFSSSIGTVSGRDWTGSALVSRGSKELSALFVTGATVPSTGYLGQVELQVTQPLEDGATLIVKSMSLTSGDVDPLDVSNAVISFAAMSASTCPGDFDGNGRVDIADFLSFVDVYGSSSSDATYNAQMDLDSSGSVDIADFLSFVDVYGTTCESQPPPGGGSGGGSGGGGSGSGGSGGSGGGVLVTGITNLTTDGLGSIKPVWSPDGRFIVFEESRRIYRMDSDGNNRIFLTDYVGLGGDPFIHPVWSPDGHFIAFASSHKGNPDIYRMDSDGSNVTQLTLKSDSDGNPVWSPDGRFIAFESGRDPSGIYRMDSDGSNVTLLRKGGHWPAWSPDGRFIAFTGHDGWDFQIQRMDSDGGNETDFLTSPNPGSGVYAVWSPDGRFIAFNSWFDAPGPKSNIYVMDSGGNNLIHLVNNPANAPAYDTDPVWSPDGRFIAFNSDRDGTTGVYIVGSDGSNLTRVTNNSSSYPAWSPDGRFIAFTSNIDGNIYRAEIKFGTGGETIVTFLKLELNLAIAHSLGREGPVPSITTAEMTTLRTFNASNKDISDLTGLEHATNLTELDLTSNRIVDIPPLTGLTNLTRLFLGGNNISDLAPLVANTGLGRGDEVDVRENSLSTTSRNTHIPALRARGVTVRF